MRNIVQLKVARARTATHAQTASAVSNKVMPAEVILFVQKTFLLLPLHHLPTLIQGHIQTLNLVQSPVTMIVRPGVKQAVVTHLARAKLMPMTSIVDPLLPREDLAFVNALMV